MHYYGELYGKAGSRSYFPTGKTGKDWDELEKQRDAMREALDRIARPVWWMQEDAKRTGHTLNGAMAASLADSGNYLRNIAEKALSENDQVEARRK